MPLYFHFHSANGNFDAQVKSHRCTHIKSNGERCKRQVIIGYELCWTHKRTDDEVAVKQSQIPHAGNGLFAVNGTDNNEIVFRKGDRICQYDGEHVAIDVLQQRYGNNTAPYAIQLNSGQASDGAIERTIGCLLNHSTKAKANVRFTNPNAQNKVFIDAIKNIRNKQELLVNYGKQYKFNEAGVQTSTNRKQFSV